MLYPRVTVVCLGSRNLPDAVDRFARAFEISFDDLDLVLDAIEPLGAVWTALELLTGGTSYNTWNGDVITPEDRAKWCR